MCDSVKLFTLFLVPLFVLETLYTISTIIGNQLLAITHVLFYCKSKIVYIKACTKLSIDNDNIIKYAISILLRKIQYLLAVILLIDYKPSPLLYK